MYIYMHPSYTYMTERESNRFQVDFKSVEILLKFVLACPWHLLCCHVLGDFLLGISEFLSYVAAQGTLYSNGQLLKKKKKDEYNNLLKLSRRERKDSSGVF